MADPYAEFSDAADPYADFQDAPGTAPPRRYGTGKSFDATAGGIVPTGSPAAKAAQSPVADNSFGENALEGIGRLDTDAVLAARQIYAQVTGGDQGKVTDPFTGLNAADKRQTDQPLAATGGGKVGMVAGAVPLAFLPGAGTYAGSAALGAGVGALQPTVGNESRLLNTGVGGTLGVAGKYGGDKLSSWITQRAAQPFMGWSQATGNRAAAQAVGSNADALTQPEIAAQTERLGDIFNRARDPNVSIPIGADTQDAIRVAGSGLNKSSTNALNANDEVQNLLASAKPPSNPWTIGQGFKYAVPVPQPSQLSAQQLGAISSRLGTEATKQMTSKEGDRALGQALFAVKEHADDLIGKSIGDPDLAAAYEAARPQYRTLTTLTARPTILNSATGDVNLQNLGKYLQKADKPGYLRGGNTSDLYNGARFFQASGMPPGPPSLSLATPWSLPLYALSHNPLSRAAGGAISRAGAPIAPTVARGARGLALGGVPGLLN